VEEVPGPEASLLALDEQPARAGQNEERLLIRLSVIDAALARLQDSHVDSKLRELDRRIAEDRCRLPLCSRDPRIHARPSGEQLIEAPNRSFMPPAPEQAFA
jgi:hypothetical protein